jgi:hypothetical protein
MQTRIRPQVMATHRRRVEDRLIDGRHTREQCRALGVDRVEDDVQVEARQQDQPTGEQHRREHAQGQPEHVEQRQHAERDLAPRRRIGDPEPGLVGVGDQVRVGQHRRLRRAGGPAGELQDRDIVHRVDLDLPDRTSRAHQRAELEHSRGH